MFFHTFAKPIHPQNDIAMTKIADVFYKWKFIFAWVLCITLWTILFPVVYMPTFGWPYENIWDANATFRVSILTAIVFGVTLVSRIILYFSTRHNRLTVVEHIIWLLCELIVVCLFCDLFLALHAHCGYFELLPKILMCAALVLMVPYGVLWIFYEKHQADLALAENAALIADLKAGVEHAAENAVRFCDSKNNVKLAVDTDSVFYIASAGNYVDICYENRGKMARYSLRNSMKGIEAVCAANQIVRCHRSYYINLQKVKLIKHLNDGLYAELNAEGIDDIPISPIYSGKVVELFSALSPHADFY